MQTISMEMSNDMRLFGQQHGYTVGMSQIYKSANSYLDVVQQYSISKHDGMDGSYYQVEINPRIVSSEQNGIHSSSEVNYGNKKFYTVKEADAFLNKEVKRITKLYK